MKLSNILITGFMVINFIDHGVEQIAQCPVEPKPTNGITCTLTCTSPSDGARTSAPYTIDRDFDGMDLSEFSKRFGK